MKLFPVWLRNRLTSTALEPVLSHTEKLCIVSYYSQFSTNIKMIIITQFLISISAEILFMQLPYNQDMFLYLFVGSSIFVAFWNSFFLIMFKHTLINSSTRQYPTNLQVYVKCFCKVKKTQIVNFYLKGESEGNKPTKFLEWRG